MSHRNAGGQFSWVEVMNTMRRPQRFRVAIAACTAAMTAAYLSVGALGYWSQARVPQLYWSICELRMSAPGVCCMYTCHSLPAASDEGPHSPWRPIGPACV